MSYARQVTFETQQNLLHGQCRNLALVIGIWHRLYSRKKILGLFLQKKLYKVISHDFMFYRIVFDQKNPQIK